jgi:glycosyltransferase involved in cell wall biosynthesis
VQQVVLNAAVYNRFLASRGGGERHSGMLAQVLAADGNAVDLITHDEVDKDQLGEHLGIDLRKVTLRVLQDLGENELAQASAGYDLFVNASYMSRLRPKARHNLYLCYFPTPADFDLAPWRKALARTIGPHLRAVSPSFVHGKGWFPGEGGLRRSWVWTNGLGRLILPPGPPTTIAFDLGRPGASESATLVVTGPDDSTLLTAEASPAAFTPLSVDLPERTQTWTLAFSSGTFVPGADDPRHLGVAVSRLRITGVSKPRERLAARLPWLMIDGTDCRFVGHYERVLANSEYTRDWVQRYWNADADVLFPPVDTRGLRPGVKARRIVNVGRFFARGHGHSKKQLELVRAFGQMVRKGGLDGWELHLVGGVEATQRPYLEEVRRAAKGLPVELHPNAPRAKLQQLLATSAIFWAATGLGEDEQRAPWAFEHFGITTVEAMTAGCVPVVIDKAGQREIVRQGVDGYRWETIAELEARTRELIGDSELRERLAAAAAQRAEEFSEDAFADRWHAIAQKLGLH